MYDGEEQERTTKSVRVQRKRRSDESGGDVTSAANTALPHPFPKTTNTILTLLYACAAKETLLGHASGNNVLIPT